jgi:hypothetical protein
MQQSHTQIQYDQHLAYLEDLLKKHERGEGIRYEDLQHSWKALTKKCKDCNQDPMVRTIVTTYFYISIRLT